MGFSKAQNLPVTWKQLIWLKGVILGAVIVSAAWAWENAVPGQAASKDSVEAIAADVAHVKTQVDTLVRVLIEQGAKRDGN